ncbi:hypothetical protein DSM104635_01032 [Terricaulis silvestris]|uniref:Uncharacterized protein n=1 Tax=Terricaulis silvestris TaxID=2686094 RepID=A0A6I6MLW3_9CAUL|nr:hypothetical protein DSM104635_01032 [Terricaulis silvestris]
MVRSELKVQCESALMRSVAGQGNGVYSAQITLVILGLSKAENPG